MKIPIGESRLLSTDLNLTEILEIEGELKLEPSKSITITTTKNIILTGKLISKPNPDVIHRILFTGINENNFVGGGDTVLDSDIGLWVVGAGQLDLQGIPNGEVIKELVIKNPDWIEEGMRVISRNVRIEGTPTGQSHVFIKSSKPQTIKFVQFRYLGPRKDRSGDGIKELVTGRYACHFHHSENGSRGSIIEGCIARDCNNHCFVPHGSHGITMRNNIVYNVTETPFWYDLGHKTNDLLWENNLVANVKYVPRSQDQDSDNAPTFGVAGFNLGFGDGNICRGNVVIGTSGDTVQSAGFLWPEIRVADVTAQPESPWTFEDNIIINCPLGLGGWQNNLHHHPVIRTIIINCKVPIFHGAYENHYLFKGGYVKGGTCELRAASATTNRIRFESIEFDAGGADACVVANEGPLNGVAPILFLNCKFTGFNKYAIIDQNTGEGVKNIDVVNCGLGPEKYKVTVANEVIRVQEGNQAWKITKSGTTVIAKFAPSTWGTGTGLKAEYFTSDFKTLLLSRIEPNVNLFDLTHPSPHYLVPTSFAARWTGKIQPQITGNHTFTVFSGGGMKLWVNGVSLLDSWDEKYPAEFSSKVISLTAGQLYDIKLEFVNTDDRAGCMLYWACGIIKKEFVPMSQLYPGDVKPPDPPVNQKPVADAGADQLIGIAFYLTGKGADADGIITGYKWEQVSGPLSVIVTATDRNTLVNPSGKGEYVFRLMVTDDKGANGVDEVRVVVG
jgi:parallel beta-helix repeat protein